MEPAATTSIQVLLQAAEFLEHWEHRDPPGLTEAEHGYASLCPERSRRAVGSVRSVHNALEKHRRAQLRCCLERLKQQVPVGAGPARPTTLSLLHRARLHIQWVPAETGGAGAEGTEGQGPAAGPAAEPAAAVGMAAPAHRRGTGMGRQPGLISALRAFRGRGCRNRGGWCGVQWGPAAQLRHWEGPQLLQPSQPRILTVPTAFPALPTCFFPDGNAALASSQLPG
ncbi:max dimerization protein 3 isoform X1 [Pithys albifrons albifrons]|uniref:max dimerization protein 3 isoform X1 n=1 Tax=Pithys albifrons albifrons TaxID=3385563 RepID=UPI003A5D1E94